MVAVEWSNGVVDEATTWQGLMDEVRRVQWRPFTEEGFRWEMGKRALRWSGTEIDVGAEPREFFRELERAGLVQVVTSKEED